jgi:hypothetical protein
MALLGCGIHHTRMLTAVYLCVAFALQSDGRDKQFGRTWHRSHWFAAARFPRAGDISQVKSIWHHASDAVAGAPSSIPRH